MRKLTFLIIACFALAVIMGGCKKTDDDNGGNGDGNNNGGSGNNNKEFVGKWDYTTYSYPYWNWGTMYFGTAYYHFTFNADNTFQMMLIAPIASSSASYKGNYAVDKKNGEVNFTNIIRGEDNEYNDKTMQYEFGEDGKYLHIGAIGEGGAYVEIRNAFKWKKKEE